MVRDKNVAATILARSGWGEDAVFMGWQETRVGEPFALFNITAEGHPSFGSTVAEKSLRELDLQVPGAPLPQGSVKKFWA